MERRVLTVNDVEGFHNWPAARGECSFLQFRHRHIFRIQCKFAVSHNDREVEVFMRQNEIRELLKKRYGEPCEFGGMSCEDICQEIIEAFADCIEVETREDERGGAALTR